LAEAREPDQPGASGPTAADVVAACRALTSILRGARVEDLAILDGTDDLLLFLRDGADQSAGRVALQIAVGAARGRVTTTRRRFPRHAFITGPRVDSLRRALDGAVFVEAAERPGDRACRVRFATSSGDPVDIHAELHGARGLWALCDADGTIRALSRLPGGRGARLRPGARYEPPPTPPASTPGATGNASQERDPEAVLAGLDEAFRTADRAREEAADREELSKVLDREEKRRHHRLEGLRRQARQARDPASLRRDADMILAYCHGPLAAQPTIEVPDPERPEHTITIQRDTSLLPHVEAERLYRDARRREDGRAVAAERLAEAERAVEALRPVRATFEQGDLGQARAQLELAGVLEPRRPKAPDAATQKLRKLTGGENFRRFRTVEGLDVLVGRDDRQNDRLTTRIARGDDMWMHVGRGYAGSHVLIRVPKGRSASLESLLDGATLAVHFSKVRGAATEEVLYTAARNVRKAKGLPPGKVLATRTRSIRVRLEPDRLQRLLDSDPAHPPTR